MSPSPTRWQASTISESVHQPGYHSLSHLGDSLRLLPTKPAGLPRYFQWLFHMNVLSWLMLQTFLKFLRDFPKISQTSSIWPLCNLYLLLSSPRPGTRGSLGLQLGFSRAPPSPAQVAATCRSFCSLCQVAPGRAPAVADFVPPRRPQSQCTW